jgi:hypothetical protein
MMTAAATATADSQAGSKTDSQAGSKNLMLSLDNEAIKQNQACQVEAPRQIIDL